jgi:hypothetical protein
MQMASWLWAELRDQFEADDGSLPEIRVDYSDPQAMIRGYALLRKRAQRVGNRGAMPGASSFWSTSEKTDRPVDSVPNAAALVVSGEAEPFHVVFGGIQSHGITLPDLGVFVFRHQLALDYRMGAQWGPAKVEALFGLLSALASLDPRASLSLEEGIPHEVVARFQGAWRRYIEEHAA